MAVPSFQILQGILRYFQSEIRLIVAEFKVCVSTENFIKIQTSYVHTFY